jgi:polyisoprenoid-binding protein YceI
MRPFFLFLLILLCPELAAQWRLSQAVVSFRAWAWGMEYRGIFPNPECHMFIPEGSDDSTLVSGRVDVRRVETGNFLLDRILQSESYFDSRNYPFITVRRLRISRINFNWIGVFEVTLKGRKKVYQLPLSWDPMGNYGYMRATWFLNLQEFGIGLHNPFLKPRVQVQVHFELESLYNIRNKKILPYYYR